MNIQTFNLIDQSWLKVMGRAPVSLKKLFMETETDYELAGHPIEKLIAFRLLLAIVQCACPLKDKRDWKQLTLQKMAADTVAYLNKWHDRFDLYGVQYPFLQFPELLSKKALTITTLALGKASGNTTVLTESQSVGECTESDKVYILLQQILFALGGKKCDQHLCLDGVKKSGSGAPGSAVGTMGYLHAYMKGSNLLDSLRLNLWTAKDIEESGCYVGGLGVPPWENMPATESDATAVALKTSYLGRLIPMNRYCRLVGNSLHMTEGLQMAGLKEGVADPSVTMSFVKGKAKAIWAQTEKSPWRQMDAMLAFLSGGEKSGWKCRQLARCIPRSSRMENIQGIWCAGIALSSNAGEQYLSGTDDFVEYEFMTPHSRIDEGFYDDYVMEMKVLQTLSQRLDSAVQHYWGQLNADKSVKTLKAKKALRDYWLDAESLVPDIITICKAENKSEIRERYARIVGEVYDHCCPEGTAKQLIAKIQNAPRLRRKDLFPEEN